LWDDPPETSPGGSLRLCVRWALAAFLILCLPLPAWCQSPSGPPPLTAYGSLPSLELVEVSATGSRLAFIAVLGEQRTLVVVDVASNTPLGRAAVGQVKIRDLRWIGDDRVLITTSTTQALPFFNSSRRELFLGQIYEPATGRIVEALGSPDSLLNVLMGPTDVLTTPEGPLVLVRAYSFEETGGLDLYSVDPRSGRGRRAETMPYDVESYVLDPFGRSVARAEYDARSREWSLRFRQGGSFREVWKTTAPLDAPALMGLGMSGDSVIVAADRPDLSREGREDADFFDVKLDTGIWRPVRFEFSPTALLFHPTTRKLIGASRLEAMGRRYVFSDDDAGALWEVVQQTFPGQSPELVSWSDDLRTIVVFTSDDGDAGSYHYINLDRQSMAKIGAAYPSVSADQIAPVQAVSYVAADGLEIHGYLTLPPGKAEATGLPLIVLAHGGPASRDMPGFDWWAQALASRGYAVLQANFRGSTGYGAEFLEAGYGEWGRKMQTDLSDGVRHLAGQGMIDPSRVCIVGGSYGGYAAMAGPTLDRGVYRCAVAVAGVSDLRRMVAHEADTGGRRDSEAVRYWNRFMGAERLGDRSLDERSPARLAQQADAPILLLHGRDDTVVPIEQSRLMASALRRANKPFEFIELAGEDHWLSRAETRQKMLAETVRFLQANNPVD